MAETEYGDGEYVRANEILRCLVGSGLHGTAVGGTDDRDEMGIYVESPTSIFGYVNDRDNYVFRTVGEGERSGPGDVDLIIYSLRKYLELAIKGNPTALQPLFAPDDFLIVKTTLGNELRALRQHFLSQQAAERFLGYMHGQHQRMLGQSKRHVPNRPELIEKYGWDTKYGAHALRLGLQGLELVRHGTMTLPMAGKSRDLVLAVKTGEHSMQYVSEYLDLIEVTMRELLDKGATPLPVQPNVKIINEWAADAHLEHWGVINEL